MKIVCPKCKKPVDLVRSLSADGESFDDGKTVKAEGVNCSNCGWILIQQAGRDGAWKESEYFTPEVGAIADRILGPVRVRLGYREGGNGLE